MFSPSNATIKNRSVCKCSRHSAYTPTTLSFSFGTMYVVTTTFFRFSVNFMSFPLRLREMSLHHPFTRFPSNESNPSSLSLISHSAIRSISSAVLSAESVSVMFVIFEKSPFFLHEVTFFVSVGFEYKLSSLPTTKTLSSLCVRSESRSLCVRSESRGLIEGRALKKS